MLWTPNRRNHKLKYGTRCMHTINMTIMKFMKTTYMSDQNYFGGPYLVFHSLTISWSLTSLSNPALGVYFLNVLNLTCFIVSGGPALFGTSFWGVHVSICDISIHKLCMYVCMYASSVTIYLCVCLSVCLSIYLSIHLSVYLIASIVSMKSIVYIYAYASIRLR